ncbi:hypothetical protein AMELA_G00297750, partial [Ameiurus melas]
MEEEKLQRHCAIITNTHCSRPTALKFILMVRERRHTEQRERDEKLTESIAGQIHFNTEV